MSQVSGHAIRCQHEGDQEAFASRAPEFEIRGWVASYQAIRDGSLQSVSSAVSSLTHSRPSHDLRAHLSGRTSSGPGLL